MSFDLTFANFIDGAIVGGQLRGSLIVPSGPPGGYFYFELYINNLNGNFYGGPGQVQIGFADINFNLYDPSLNVIDDGGYTCAGLAAGTDVNSFGLYQAAFFGTGYNSFGNNRNGGVGIALVENGAYGFAVDAFNGDFFWRNLSSPGWNGDPFNPKGEQNSGGLAGLTNGYDLTGFGANLFGIAISSGYYSAIGANLNHTAGINQITLNTGASPFRATPPHGWLPWDASGTTTWVIAPSSTCAIINNGLTANWSISAKTTISAALSSTGKTIQ